CGPPALPAPAPPDGAAPGSRGGAGGTGRSESRDAATEETCSAPCCRSSTKFHERGVAGAEASRSPGASKTPPPPHLHTSSSKAHQRPRSPSAGGDFGGGEIGKPSKAAASARKSCTSRFADALLFHRGAGRSLAAHSKGDEQNRSDQAARADASARL